MLTALTVGFRRASSVEASFLPFGSAQWARLHKPTSKHQAGHILSAPAILGRGQSKQQAIESGSAGAQPTGGSQRDLPSNKLQQAVSSLGSAIGQTGEIELNGAATNGAAAMHRLALVYSGPGAGGMSLEHLTESLRRELEPHLEVQTIGPEELLRGEWTKQCTILAVPGGADLPYCELLNGRGNRIIRDFVESGGSYLGVCAGAYFGSGRVEFEAGTTMEVVGNRELAFFPGVAQGCAYPGFRYQTLEGASVVPLSFREGGGEAWQDCRDYVNGGPLFARPGHSLQDPEGWQTVEEAFPDVEVLAAYPELNNAAAALRCPFGNGWAVLCGTHPETIPEAIVGIPHERRIELQEELQAAAEGRGRLWRAVLRAALPQLSQAIRPKETLAP